MRYRTAQSKIGLLRAGAPGLLIMALIGGIARSPSAETSVDLSGYRPECEVRVEGWNEHLRITWPAGGGETSRKSRSTCRASIR